MFGFLKKKVTAREVGAILAKLAMDNSNIEQMVSQLKGNQALEDLLMDESLFLQLFSVDFATAGALGPHSKEKKAVLDSYYDHLDALTNRMNATDPRVGKSFSAAFHRRLLVYGQAVNTPHRNGPAWNVGKEFARLCGKEKDLDTIMFGSFLFGSSVKWVTDTIKSCRVIL
jgi:hypothetical protein